MRPVFDLKLSRGSRRSIPEKVHRFRVAAFVSFEVERTYLLHRLLRDAQYFATRREHVYVGTFAEQNGNNLRARSDKVFAVVEHNQHGPGAKPARQRRLNGLTRRFTNPESESDRLRNQARLGQRCEVYLPHAIGVGIAQSSRGLER